MGERRGGGDRYLRYASPGYGAVSTDIVRERLLPELVELGTPPGEVLPLRALSPCLRVQSRRLLVQGPQKPCHRGYVLPQVLEVVDNRMTAGLTDLFDGGGSGSEDRGGGSGLRKLEQSGAVAGEGGFEVDERAVQRFVRARGDRCRGARGGQSRGRVGGGGGGGGGGGSGAGRVATRRLLDGGEQRSDGLGVAAPRTRGRDQRVRVGPVASRVIVEADQRTQRAPRGVPCDRSRGSDGFRSHSAVDDQGAVVVVAVVERARGQCGYEV